MQTKILIADDHGLVRDGLCRLIGTDDSLSLVGVAENGEEAIRLVTTACPDLLLVDLNMPDIGGVDVIKAARRLNPDLRVLVLTAHVSASYVHSALCNGADGYVVKTEEGEAIIHAIACVMQRKSYLSPEVTGEVVRGYVQSPGQFDKGPYATLTPREREIVKFILLGEISNKDLSNRFFVSDKTIERHKTNIFRKLEVSNSREVIQLFKDHDPRAVSG